MSWGERSCANKPCPIPNECSMETCNVRCREYVWDGKTEPDSATFDKTRKPLDEPMNRKERRAFEKLQRSRK